MTDHLLATVDAGVGTITINRPEALNAFTAAMSDRLAEIVHDFELDPAVRAVLIRGEGRAFCAGGDVKSFHDQLVADQKGYAKSMERTVVSGHLAYHRLRRMPKPVLVAVHGATAGLGISLMCCADLVIAAENTQFSLAYRHIGLALDGGVSFFLPRIVGERRALQIALMGERFGTDRAVEWGLVNWTAADERLQEEARTIASQLASGPTRALGEIKQLIRRSLQSSWDEQSNAEALAMSGTIGSADHLEGVTAFVEKRRAVFTGA
jgi:2-(1,2-epoxy-1,2-dihydrophenyl)acetyl-CoA isomerase